MNIQITTFYKNGEIDRVLCTGVLGRAVLRKHIEMVRSGQIADNVRFYRLDEVRPVSLLELERRLNESEEFQK